MTSYFYNGAKRFFFEILSTLVRYNISEFHLHIKTGINLFSILLSTTISKQLKNVQKCFCSGETAFQSYIGLKYLVVFVVIKLPPTR